MLGIVAHDHQQAGQHPKPQPQARLQQARARGCARPPDRTPDREHEQQHPGAAPAGERVAADGGQTRPQGRAGGGAG
jgi:hypothetical protein